MLAFILLFAGINKIISPSPLIDNLNAAFSFLPESATILIVTLLPLIEIGLGALLILSLYKKEIKDKRKVILLTTTFLLGLFLAYSIYGYVIGLKNDCGCFGNAVKSSFGWGMMIRNFVFVILAVTLLIMNNKRRV